MHWSAVHVPFASSLLFADSRLTTKTTIRGDPEPELRDDSLSWSSPSLGLTADYTARSNGGGQQLHESVSWRCVMPRADAVVQLPDRTIRGAGYAEVLELSIAPWQLPISELLWGRATCNGTSLVWIRWIGAVPLQIVFRDGVAEQPARIDDDEVVLADGTRIEMRDRAVIREETLASTLKPLGAMASLLPRSLTHTMERKWRSRGTIFAGDRPIDEGWVIHERVTFA